MSLEETDLHVHLIQSLCAMDVFELGRAKYREIDWNRFGFLERYEQTVGVRLDPVAMFAGASPEETIHGIGRAMLFGPSEAGDFAKFNIRSFFPIVVAGYYLDKNEHERVVKLVLERHRREGISYVEYRNGVGYSDEDKEEWKDWHKRFMQALKDGSDATFQAKYIIRVTDAMYDAVRELVREEPDLLEVLVGLDFSGDELPAKLHARFFDRLHADNERSPDRALDMVVHVGEVFYDKSVESAIRWCHEYAERGVKRMGHCIALGLDPAITVSRRPGAHTQEQTAERIDQIDYDLKHARRLQDIGVRIDSGKLLDERRRLIGRDPTEPVSAAYDDERIAELRTRQDFVLEEVRRRGIVIETCPTSNLLIGGIPAPEHHPFRRFYDSRQKVAVCTDDPGVFGRFLGEEVDLIAGTFGLDRDELEERIGDPYEYRLGRSRAPKGASLP